MELFLGQPTVVICQEGEQYGYLRMLELASLGGYVGRLEGNCYPLSMLLGYPIEHLTFLC
jgi:hypothetical protein